MPRPGTQIDIADDAPFGGPVLDSGQAFFAGVSERGPLDEAVRLGSLGGYEDTFGGRSGGSLLYDAVGAYFAEGGTVLFASRISGPAADVATILFGTATANAASPGAWGNGVKVDAIAPATVGEVLSATRPRAGGTPTVVTVTVGGEVVERSSVVNDVDELVTWAQEHSNLVRFVKGADNVLPAAGVSATLAGGADDPTVDATTIGEALARFPYELGPGQVAAPGLTSSEAHDALLAHVDSTRRTALLDLPDSGDAQVLAAAVTRLEGAAGSRFAGAFGPWALYPGQASGVTVEIPYSGVQAGLIARQDAATGNPNASAAGARGISRYATGLTQTFTDEERTALNELGVDVAVVKYGEVRTYGYRTAAGPADTDWLWLGGSRVVAQIAHEADALAENYVLQQIDGGGVLFASLHNDLKGMLLEHYRTGALFGATPADAFSVDTGPGVNTIETISNGEVHAVLRVKSSPAAEWVQISIVKVPVETVLTSAA
jgi:hypothetical protein